MKRYTVFLLAIGQGFVGAGQRALQNEIAHRPARGQSGSLQCLLGLRREPKVKFFRACRAGWHRVLPSSIVGWFARQCQDKGVTCEYTVTCRFDHFMARADESGGPVGYQILINEALRRSLEAPALDAIVRRVIRAERSGGRNRDAAAHEAKIRQFNRLADFTREGIYDANVSLCCKASSGRNRHYRDSSGFSRSVCVFALDRVLDSRCSRGCSLRDRSALGKMASRYPRFWRY
jgi:hypothetical protein